MKTGECYCRDDKGALWLAESFMNENDGLVWTKVRLIAEAEENAT